VRPLIFVSVISMLFSVPFPRQRDGEPFSIAVNVELVVFNVSVIDSKGRHVAGLKASDFRVLEDGRLMNLHLFEAENSPASIGLVIDNSGSMRNKQLAVRDAALSFVDASNARDEMFLLYFNDKVHTGLAPEILFTNDGSRIRSAFAEIIPGGRTALYDALSVGLSHLARGSRERKVLIVFSDGGDNASRHHLNDVLKAARSSSATIYAIGMYDSDDPDKNPGVLRKIAQASGGRAYFPRSLKDVDRVWREIAGEIRSEYTIGFLPGRSSRDSAFRNVKVEVEGRRSLTVMTRKGYAIPEVEKP
jgi:Ca-activated chloride channel homolog